MIRHMREGMYDVQGHVAGSTAYVASVRWRTGAVMERRCLETKPRVLLEATSSRRDRAKELRKCVTTTCHIYALKFARQVVTCVIVVWSVWGGNCGCFLMSKRATHGKCTDG